MEWLPLGKSLPHRLAAVATVEGRSWVGGWTEGPLFWPHESRETEETFQGLVKDYSRGHSTVGLCVLIRVKWIRLSERKFSMLQGNKAMVVAGLKPRVLCQHPKERMQGVWLQLGAEPWIWPVLGRWGPGNCNCGGLVLFDSCSAGLVGAVSQFPASYETSLAIWGSQRQGQGPKEKKRTGSFL